MVRPRRQLDVVQAFRGPRVLTLEQACRRLQSSRSTVLRRLDEHGYHSSYNQSGKFLTIAEVAEFDARGLWVWNTARFSNHGNLKQTINYFVDDSPRGMTQEEVATLLGVRTHNTLWALVQEKRIQRQRLGPTFVYLSRRPSIRTGQVGRRESVLAELRKPRPTSRQVIATLLELIKDPQCRENSSCSVVSEAGCRCRPTSWMPSLRGMTSIKKGLFSRLRAVVSRAREGNSGLAGRSLAANEVDVFLGNGRLSEVWRTAEGPAHAQAKRGFGTLRQIAGHRAAGLLSRSPEPSSGAVRETPSDRRPRL